MPSLHVHHQTPIHLNSLRRRPLPIHPQVRVIPIRRRRLRHEPDRRGPRPAVVLPPRRAPALLAELLVVAGRRVHAVPAEALVHAGQAVEEVVHDGRRALDRPLGVPVCRDGARHAGAGVADRGVAEQRGELAEVEEMHFEGLVVRVVWIDLGIGRTEMACPAHL